MDAEVLERAAVTWAPRGEGRRARPGQVSQNGSRSWVAIRLWYERRESFQMLSERQRLVASMDHLGNVASGR